MNRMVLTIVPTLDMSVLGVMSRDDGRSEASAAHTRCLLLRVASKEPVVLLQLHVEFVSAN
jgi:hypothetical protein